MTLNCCAEAAEALPRRRMGNAPWQRRIKAAGLTQKVLARLLGRAENTVSRQLSEQWEDGVVPQNVWSPIIAWEIMTEEQRRQWIERVDRQVELARRERVTKRKPGET